MKYLFLLFAFTAFLGLASAQIPQGINFQGVARNADTSPKPAGTVIQVEFKIWDSPSAGNIVYNEIQTLTTNGVGLFTCIIGMGSVQPGSGLFSNVNWASGQKYLEVLVDGQSGGRQAMMSVPYALYSDKSKTTYIQAFQPESANATDTERLVYKPVPQVQVTVPESGTYLVLANLGGSATSGDSGLSGFVRKLIPGGTEDLFDFRVQAKPNGQLLTGFESSSWAVASLSANDVVRLYYHMGSWVTPHDSSPYNINRGKLILVKLN